MFLQVPGPAVDIIDSLIYVGIVLLVLSQLNEKIVTFIRTYIKIVKDRAVNFQNAESGNRRQRMKRHLRSLFSILLRWVLLLDRTSDLARRQIDVVNKDQQPRIEFAITKLSIITGLFLAFIFRADLIELLRAQNPQDVLLHWEPIFELEGWSQVGSIMKAIFGCTAAGFILTFGSKFFHELLEILYEIKRGRRQLTDEYTYRATDMADLETRLAARMDDPVRRVLEFHKDVLMKTFPQIVSMARVFDDYGISFLEIRIRGNERKFIDDYRFVYQDIQGEKVLPTSRLWIFLNTATPKPQQDPQLNIGSWLRNRNNNESQGTLGFFATRQSDNRTVLVTCYHVLHTEGHSWDDFMPANPNLNRVVGTGEDGEELELGSIVDAQLTEWVDGAVVLTGEKIHGHNHNRKGHAVNEVRNVGWNDYFDVWLYGGATNGAYGRVYAVESKVRFTYDDNLEPTFSNLLCVISNEPGRRDGHTIALSQKGDSGALLIDKYNRAVGMIIGGNDEISYAVPISRVLEIFKLNWLADSKTS